MWIFVDDEVNNIDVNYDNDDSDDDAADDDDGDEDDADDDNDVVRKILMIFEENKTVVL